jgi:hypothetical protein
MGLNREREKRQIWDEYIEFFEPDTLVLALLGKSRF